MQQPIDFVIRAATDDTAATLREYAARRLSFALRRFPHRLPRRPASDQVIQRAAAFEQWCVCTPMRAGRRSDDPPISLARA